MPRQCDCHFTDVFTLISLYKAFVFSFTIQFETWRLFCLRYNHRAQVIYCGPNIMTAILQTNLKCIFLHGNCCTFLEISFKFENTLDNLVNDAFKYFSWMETFAVFIQISFFYASAFRRRRHYVFGLSVRPSEAWNTLFWHVHGSVGPPDQP